MSKGHISSDTLKIACHMAARELEFPLERKENEIQHRALETEVQEALTQKDQQL